ncbi:MAG: hypothetical protein LBL01_04620 [Bifidobacteriaceae bacterium]|jgi:PIN domain nuclease of toxin-antitoxin system|nr:hypothetical protein [Bifidobacteriaceae bacterium]
MRHLLDTHTVLWFLWDSERLSRAAAAIIEGERASDGRALVTADEHIHGYDVPWVW